MNETYQALIEVMVVIIIIAIAFIFLGKIIDKSIK